MYVGNVCMHVFFQVFFLPFSLPFFAYFFWKLQEGHVVQMLNVGGGGGSCCCKMYMNSNGHYIYNVRCMLYGTTFGSNLFFCICISLYLSAGFTVEFQFSLQSAAAATASPPLKCPAAIKRCLLPIFQNKKATKKIARTHTAKKWHKKHGYFTVATTTDAWIVFFSAPISTIK